MISINSSQHIVIPRTGVNLSKSEDVLAILKSVSNDDIDTIGKEIELMNHSDDGSNKGISSNRIDERKLVGNSDGLIHDIINNYVTIKEGVSMRYYMGKVVELHLPKHGNFPGYDFSCWISKNPVVKKDLQSEPIYREFREISFEYREICKLLETINQYLKSYKVITDNNFRYNLYESRLLNYEHNVDFIKCCNAGKFLKNILGLDSFYWLKNSFIYRSDRFFYRFDCSKDNCFFESVSNRTSEANFMLKKHRNY